MTGYHKIPNNIISLVGSVVVNIGAGLVSVSSSKLYFDDLRAILSSN